MNDNPFSPPSATVADVAVSRPGNRPPEVLRAVQLMWGLYIASVLMTPLNWDLIRRTQPPLMIALSFVLGLAIVYWLYSKILQGRNWARIVVLVFLILGALAYLMPTFRKAMEMQSIVTRIYGPLSQIGYAYAMWLLFSAPGKEWFQRDG